MSMDIGERRGLFTSLGDRAGVWGSACIYLFIPALQIRQKLIFPLIFYGDGFLRVALFPHSSITSFIYRIIFILNINTFEYPSLHFSYYIPSKNTQNTSTPLLSNSTKSTNIISNETPLSHHRPSEIHSKKAISRHIKTATHSLFSHRHFVLHDYKRSPRTNTRSAISCALTTYTTRRKESERARRTCSPYKRVSIRGACINTSGGAGRAEISDIT